MLPLLSALADVGFVLPFLGIAALVLAACGETRTALTWIAAVMLAVLVALALRPLALAGWGAPHFPSGHVTLAVSCYGGGISLLMRGRGGRAGLLVVLLLLAVGEGTSRVLLTEHSWPDVAGGFVVGLSGLLLTRLPIRARRLGPGAARWLALATLPAAAAGFTLSPWLDALLRRVADV